MIGRGPSARRAEADSEVPPIEFDLGAACPCVGVGIRQGGEALLGPVEQTKPSIDPGQAESRPSVVGVVLDEMFESRFQIVGFFDLFLMRDTPVMHQVESQRALLGEGGELLEEFGAPALDAVEIDERSRRASRDAWGRAARPGEVASSIGRARSRPSSTRLVTNATLAASGPSASIFAR